MGKNETGYSECRGLGMNAELERRGRFNVYVKKTGKSSCEIKVNAAFDHPIQYALNSTSRRYTNPCVSTGKLEAAMFNLISEKAK
jgi:hypothetical protein